MDSNTDRCGDTGIDRPRINGQIELPRIDKLTGTEGAQFGSEKSTRGEVLSHLTASPETFQ